MAASERDSGRAEAMPRGRDGWRAEVMTSGRDGERVEGMAARDGMVVSGSDAEAKGCWASGASSASERHDCG